VKCAVKVTVGKERCDYTGHIVQLAQCNVGCYDGLSMQQPERQGMHTGILWVSLETAYF